MSNFSKIPMVKKLLKEYAKTSKKSYNKLLNFWFLKSQKQVSIIKNWYYIIIWILANVGIALVLFIFINEFIKPDFSNNTSIIFGTAIINSFFSILNLIFAYFFKRFEILNFLEYEKLIKSINEIDLILDFLSNKIMTKTEISEKELNWIKTEIQNLNIEKNKLIDKFLNEKT